MHKKENNFAFIDSQNLNLAIRLKDFLPYLLFMNELREKLQYEKKRPQVRVHKKFSPRLCGAGCRPKPFV